MSKEKARIATFAFCTAVFGLLYGVWETAPYARMWILAFFAFFGAQKFVRVVFIWLITEDAPIEIKLPEWLQRLQKRFHKKTPKTYAEWAEAGK
jgi:hypothetical protein